MLIIVIDYLIISSPFFVSWREEKDLDPKASQALPFRLVSRAATRIFLSSPLPQRSFTEFDGCRHSWLWLTIPRRRVVCFNSTQEGREPAPAKEDFILPIKWKLSITSGHPQGSSRRTPSTWWSDAQNPIGKVWIVYFVIFLLIEWARWRICWPSLHRVHQDRNCDGHRFCYHGLHWILCKVDTHPNQ